MRTRLLSALGTLALGLLACSSSNDDSMRARASDEAMILSNRVGGLGPGGPPPHSGEPAPVQKPKPHYNEVFSKNTHNSYWVNVASSLGQDVGASGTQERITDQLLHEHVRSLELDLHYDGGHPGQFTVYHTDNGLSNSTCRDLSDCLELLQRLDYLVPNHEVVTLVLELKEVIYGGVFGNTQTGQNHTMMDLDRTLWEHLGSRLYTPRERMSATDCAGLPNLRACVAKVGWPTTEELRGRYIVSVIGNWGNNYFDWMDYATKNGGVGARAAFPFRSVMQADVSWLTDLPAEKRALLTGPNPVPGHGDNPFIELTNASYTYTLGYAPDVASRVGSADYRNQLQDARDASVLWQVENDVFSNPAGDPDKVNKTGEFFSDLVNGVARRSSMSLKDQGYRYDDPNQQYQILQTDYPWSFANDQPGSAGIKGLPTNPSRPFFERMDVPGETGERKFDENDLTEPGIRMYMHPPAGIDYKVEATVARPAGTDMWEFQATNTTISHDANGPAPQAQPTSIGSFVARSSSDPSKYVMVSRWQGDDAGRTVNVQVAVNNGSGSVLHSYTVHHQAPSMTDLGDLLRVVVTQGGGASTVTVATAAQMNLDGTPHWNLLPDGPFTVQANLDAQGFASLGDVLFSAPRHNGVLVRPSDFTSFYPSAASVVDLSWCGVDGTACAPKDFVKRETVTSWDEGSYVRVHEASAKASVFGNQDRHLYTNDRNEVFTSGLRDGFVDTKFALRAAQPDGSWAPLFRCADIGRDKHMSWVSTSAACDNAGAGDGPGLANGTLGFISTTARLGMQALIHVRKPTNGGTHDHAVAFGANEAFFLHNNGYEILETIGYAYDATTVVTKPCVPATQCTAGACGQQSDGCGGTIQCPFCANGTMCSPQTSTCVVPSAVDLCVWGCLDTEDTCLHPKPGSPREGKDQCAADEVACEAACRCVKSTCASLGRTCGGASDGCGGTLSCGTCAGNATCNASGQCEAPTQTPAECRADCADEEDACFGTRTPKSTCVAKYKKCMAGC